MSKNKLMRELQIGHLLKRYDEVFKLIDDKQAKSERDIELVALIEETSLLMKKITNYDIYALNKDE